MKPSDALNNCIYCYNCSSSTYTSTAMNNNRMRSFDILIKLFFSKFLDFVDHIINIGKMLFICLGVIILPPCVLNLCNFMSFLQWISQIFQKKFAKNYARRFFRFRYECQFEGLISKHPCFFLLVHPIISAFLLFGTLKRAQHDNQSGILLPYHLPKSFECVIDRSLSRDKCLFSISSHKSL